MTICRGRKGLSCWVQLSRSLCVGSSKRPGSDVAWGVQTPAQALKGPSSLLPPTHRTGEDFLTGAKQAVPTWPELLPPLRPSALQRGAR